MKTNVQIIAVYTFATWEGPLASLRYRGPAQEADLEILRGNEELRIFPERVSLADLVIIQRDFPRTSTAYDEIVTRARTEGKKVIYETDDALLELPDNHIVKAFHTDLFFPMLRAIIEADAVTTSTPVLGAYLQAFNRNTIVLPNYLNDKLWKIRTIDKPVHDHNPVVLGYMGTNTHQLDLESVRSVLSPLLDRYGDQILLKFWGGEPPKSYQTRSNVEWIAFDMIGYTEFAAYFSEQECDIFIAPLCDNLFNRCKSPIKFLEYSALGVPGVYSRLPPYENIVKHGKNGFLASTPDEWEKYLIQLIETPSLRHAMGAAAQETVRAKWLLSQHALEWKDAFTKVLKSRNAAPPERERLDVFLRAARQVQQRHHELDQYAESLKNQMMEKGQQVQTLEAELSEKEQRVQSLTAELLAKELALKALREQVAEIFESRSWRIAKRFQRLRLWLAPLGSLREHLIRRLVRIVRPKRSSIERLVGNRSNDS